MGRQLFCRLGILCGIVLIASAPVTAQQLIGPGVNPARSRISTAQERSESARFRYATLDADALRGSRISLNLFPDVNLEAIERGRGRQYRSETWTGLVEGDPFSSVILAQDDSGLLFGKVEFEGRTFLVRPKSGRVHAILEWSSQPPQDEGDDGVPLPDAGLDAAMGKLDAASVCLPTSTCEDKTVDIMVVYTPAARSALGGSHAAAQNAIAAAVAEMNAAGANSGLAHGFRLVYSDEVAYSESGDFGTDLSRLSGTTDGFMDVIHAWRDSYGADLVSLVSSTGGCGIGYTQFSSTTLSSNAAFSVASPACLTTNKTLAHEAGHNMGLHHDWFVNSSSTPCAWHHGYVNQAAFGGTTSQRWRTIMAYNNQCAQQGGFNCSRITYWSNPLNQYTGDAMGIPQGQANPSDAVFALNRTMCQVAEFRASTATQDPPMHPTDLVATGMSESAINLSWTDNASDESGYVVQRSTDGQSGWSDIATLGVNADTYSDTGLPQASSFYYRAYAFHATEQSDYSNVDSASTMISYVDQVAVSESVGYGSSSGEYSRTYIDDGTAHVLTEEETAGWLENRTSRLEVTWEFDVLSDLPATFHINAWSPTSSDGDSVVLSFSFDGSSFSRMFSLTETGDTGLYHTFDLGIAAGSTLWIRLEDTDRGRGNSSVDQVFVDHMYARTESSGDAPPPDLNEPSVHLGDLQITASGRGRWKSTVEVTVHGGDHHDPESGATVTGTWSGGRNSSCVTDDAGVCVIEENWKRKDESVSFAVTSILKPETVYESGRNDIAAVVTVESPRALSKVDLAGELPEGLTLRQNYPNPFNPTTVLEYGLPQAGHLKVSVFNTLGVEVRRLYDSREDAGWHSVNFDASGLSSGVYFAVIQAANSTESRTMLLMR